MTLMCDSVPHEVDLSSHDRYLVYSMLNRNVSFTPPNRKCECAGVVEQVVRNIFSNQVELTVKGQLFCFDEPVVIVKTNGSTHGSVVFVYGDLDPEQSDEELFEEMRESKNFYGENVDDVLTRTRPNTIRAVEFLLGPAIRRRRTWRMPGTSLS